MLKSVPEATKFYFKPKFQDKLTNIFYHNKHGKNNSHNTSWDSSASDHDNNINKNTNDGMNENETKNTNKVCKHYFISEKNKIKKGSIEYKNRDSIDNNIFCYDCSGMVFELEDKSVIKTVSHIGEQIKRLKDYNPVKLFSEMRRNEKKTRLAYINDYSRKRKEMVNFIAKLRNKYKVSINSFFLAICLLDNVCAKIVHFDVDIELLAIGCFFLAGKFLENDAYLGSFERLSNNFKKIYYSKEEIRKSEVICLGFLNFNLSFTTAKHYYELFCLIGYVFEDELSSIRNLNEFYQSGDKILKELITDFQSTYYSNLALAFATLRYLREFNSLEKTNSRISCLEEIFKIKPKSYQGAWDLLKKIKGFQPAADKNNNLLSPVLTKSSSQSKLFTLSNKISVNHKVIENNPKRVDENLMGVQENSEKKPSNHKRNFNLLASESFPLLKQSSEVHTQTNKNWKISPLGIEDLENPNAIEFKNTQSKIYSSANIKNINLKIEKNTRESGPTALVAPGSLNPIAPNETGKVKSHSQLKLTSNFPTKNLTITSNAIDKLYSENENNSNQNEINGVNHINLSNPSKASANKLPQHENELNNHSIFSFGPAGNSERVNHDSDSKLKIAKLPERNYFKFKSVNNFKNPNFPGYNSNNPEEDLLRKSDYSAVMRKINRQLKSITTNKLVNLNPLSSFQVPDKQDNKNTFSDDSDDLEKKDSREEKIKLRLMNLNKYESEKNKIKIIDQDNKFNLKNTNSNSIIKNSTSDTKKILIENDSYKDQIDNKNINESGKKKVTFAAAPLRRESKVLEEEKNQNENLEKNKFKRSSYNQLTKHIVITGSYNQFIHEHINFRNARNISKKHTVSYNDRADSNAQG